MSVIGRIFGKKKQFKAFCDISKEPVEQGYGFLLTTAQVIKSKVYWDNVMTEPETMSYTINHFKNQDATARQIRSMIFEKYSEVDKPWMISDTYIQWFDVDKSKAKAHAKSWWTSEGNYEPEDSGKAIEFLPGDKYDEIKSYAVLEAGRGKVIL